MEIQLFGGGRGCGAEVREENGSLTGFWVLRGGGFTQPVSKVSREEAWTVSPERTMAPPGSDF